MMANLMSKRLILCSCLLIATLFFSKPLSLGKGEWCSSSFCIWSMVWNKWWSFEHEFDFPFLCLFAKLCRCSMHFRVKGFFQEEEEITTLIKHAHQLSFLQSWVFTEQEELCLCKLFDVVHVVLISLLNSYFCFVRGGLCGATASDCCALIWLMNYNLANGLKIWGVHSTTSIDLLSLRWWLISRWLISPRPRRILDELSTNTEWNQLQ